MNRKPKGLRLLPRVNPCPEDDHAKSTAKATNPRGRFDRKRVVANHGVMKPKRQRSRMNRHHKRPSALQWIAKATPFLLSLSELLRELYPYLAPWLA